MVQFEQLDEQEKAWVLANEALWRRAHAIAALHPQLDVSLVHHTLVNLQRTPEERLTRGLARAAPTPLSDAELSFLRELNARGVSFVVIGMGSAVLQGATAVTPALDLWFEDLADSRIEDAARAAGGLYVSGSFGMQPPTIGGSLGDRFDVVTHAHGLGRFADELPRVLECELQGVAVRLLPLDRILASKRATGRSKDLAQLPVLEAALAVREEAARRGSLTAARQRKARGTILPFLRGLRFVASGGAASGGGASGGLDLERSRDVDRELDL